MPSEFPPIPKEILNRFPSAKDWNEKLKEFWTRSTAAIQSAQETVANYSNSRVVYSVDSFLIYAKNGIPQPMFALDSTGVKLGNVLTISTPGRKIFIGEGVFNSANTPFYVDALGNFSLGDSLVWDAATSSLTIVGSITATTGTIGGFDIGTDYIRDTANSMGMASTVSGGDDVRFWAGDTFANRATAPFRVTESGILNATNNAVIVGSVSGRLTATLAAAINAAGNLITDVVNPRLDSGLKTILSDFTFGAADFSGAVKSGTIAWNTATGAITGGSGVLLYRSGIVGANAGVATFTIDATTGAATFAGTLSAPNGNIGGWTIGATTLVGGNATLDSTGVLILGTVNDVVVLSATDATYRLWVGNATAGSAAFAVTKAGALTATGATISGSISASSGTIGGWTVGASTLAGGNATLSSAGVLTLGTANDVVIISAADATYRLWIGNVATGSAPFTVTKAGDLTASSAAIAGTISGRSTVTIAGTIDASGNVVTDLINARLNTSAKTMLSDFSFGAADYSGALKAGTIAWNTMTGAITGGSGVLVFRGGIIGAAAGVATFTLDAATGAATFAGALSAPTGSIGGWTIGASTLTGGNAVLGSSGVLTLGTGNDVVVLSAVDATYRLWIGNATAASAAFSVTKAGALSATGATISGSITSTSGTIGGFTLGADYIRDSANSFGLASTVTGGDDVRFWAGDTFANRATAPFRLTEAGAIFSTSGTIGGFTLSSTALTSTSLIIDTAFAGYGRITQIGATNTSILDGSGLVISDGSGIASNYGKTSLAFSYPAAGYDYTFGTGGLVMKASTGLSTTTLQTTGALGGSATGFNVIASSGSAGIIFGSDTVANLYRSAASTLKTDGGLVVTGTLSSGVLNPSSISIGSGSPLTSITSSSLTFSSTGGVQGVYSINSLAFQAYSAAPTITFGIGSATNIFRISTSSGVETLEFGSDTNLYRSAANTLKTDDAFVASGTISGSGVIRSTDGTIIVSVLNDGVGAYIGTQSNHDVVLIKNGAQVGVLTATGLNAAPIGATTPSTGNFTNLAATSLAGVGTRNVVVDASGNLSAP